MLIIKLKHVMVYSFKTYDNYYYYYQIKTLKVELTETYFSI